MSASTIQPIEPGEAAPDFALPAVAGTETVSLSDYRGRTPVLLALMVGLWCPFCRRQLAQISQFEGKLKALGVECLAVVGTEPERAKLYFKFRPTNVRLASDPNLTTHRAFRVPNPDPTPEMLEALGALVINPFNELPQALPFREAAKALDAIDGYAPSTADRADIDLQWTQLKALFMIDREGIVRWVNIEGSRDGPVGIGKLPSESEILEAARACAA